jgi:23S rRNA (uracil1939-C5)-methyltransferase
MSEVGGSHAPRVPVVGAVDALQQRLELHVAGVAAGGDGLARQDTGRVVFVRGALPGERVVASVVDERRDFARAELVEVLEPSPDRVVPPCPHVGDGCGGCDWQHVTPAAQRGLKAAIVADALRHQAHVDITVDHGPDLPAEGYRTTVRGLASGGRFALRERASDDAVVLGSCLVAHPLLEELIIDGSFPDGEVVLRAGARTGERLVVVDGDPTDARLPADVRVVGAEELAAGRRAWFHEEVAGHRFRVSARSFFQASPDGAEALVEAVGDAAGDELHPGRPMVDLYGGVGLFAVSLDAAAGSSLVEASASAAADARVNLAGSGVKVVRSDATRWRPRHARLVVADPPRAGLAKAGVAVVGRTGARRLVLVSCDPAALGRDARILGAAGWVLRSAALVDLFPHTSHVEVVTAFDRVRGDR